MMMWSEQLYNDIVDPPVATMGSPDYCLRVTKNLMHDFSSYIYLDALGPRLDEYQKQVARAFPFVSSLKHKRVLYFLLLLLCNHPGTSRSRGDAASEQ